MERPLLAAVEKGDCRMGRVTSICEPKTSGNMAHTVAVPVVGWHTDSLGRVPGGKAHVFFDTVFHLDV